VFMINIWFVKVKENMEGGRFGVGIRELITSSFVLNTVNPKVMIKAFLISPC